MTQNTNSSIYSIKDFLNHQVLSGILILFGIISAMVIANSPLSSYYFQAIHIKLSIVIGETALEFSLAEWINNALMTLFFLVVGFEIKRELIAGELARLKKALLPIVAAVGGMVLPIAIFLLINWNQPTQRGWGIPMATDIAFTLGILLLLGKKIPKSLKVSVTALAIIDDIGALVVIAIFYSTDLSFYYLAFVLFLCGFVIILNKLEKSNGVVFLLAGVLLWLLFLFSGIHPTIAGVVIAFLIPSNTKINFDRFAEKVNTALFQMDLRFNNRDKHFEMADAETKSAFQQIRSTVLEVEPPLQRYEKALSPFVNFIVLPLFAFVNAGIPLFNISPLKLLSPLALGIILGLMIGKSTGIFTFSMLSSKIGLTGLPSETTKRKFYGVSWLAGIGFTMSIFIAGLSFPEGELLSLAKISIIIGSILSAVAGIIILSFPEKLNKSIALEK